MEGGKKKMDVYPIINKSKAGGVVGIVIASVIFMVTCSVKAGADSWVAAPALFVFGDSLADVGNNNYLKLSLAKADFPHNGIDFPTGKPTGRFSNGYNAADFLAEKIGVSSPPAYLYMLQQRMSNFENGVNFASGGAGIFNGTDLLFRQSVPFTAQIEHYSKVGEQMEAQIGQSALQSFQSKAIHAIIIGSNDILGYHAPSSNLSKQMNPSELVGLMVNTIKSQIQRIYEMGGRKFAVMGVGAIGCCPQQRIKSDTGECNEAANEMATNYNQGLASVLAALSAQLQGFHYTYFDTYNILLHFIHNPAVYGFREVKAACCGLGNLNAVVPCIPISKYCPNRTDHLFWDLYHPTEAAYRFVIDAAFDDSLHFTYPFNLRHLISI